PTGFSPGFAGTLSTADGHTVFAKAVSPVPNPHTPSLHRREAKIVTRLPAHTPVPRLLWTYDEGEQGWIVLVFEYVHGRHPLEPWRPDELNRVLEGLAALSTVLTPSPLGPDLVGTASEVVAKNVRGWTWLRDSRPPNLDGWSARHLDRLVALEEEAARAVAGTALLHMDIRADNLLLASDRVWFVDWPHATIGAGWFDLVGFAPSVTMQGGPPPEALVEQYPGCQGADPEDITAAIAAIAGYFTHRSLQPPPPGLPTVREFQAAQGKVARQWLSERLNWT
ncbi:MAG: phosphotransferase family protein, partial [bacterium]